MQVTVSGGTGKEPVALAYNATSQSYIEAKSLAAAISSQYQSAVYYNPSSPPTGVGSGYLIIKKNFASSQPIIATGFGAVVDANNGVSSTIRGGAVGGQTVLAGSGNLVYSASIGGVTLTAGGGDNLINLTGDTVGGAIYTGPGRNTIYGGSGSTTISAGTGRNKIHGSSVSAVIDSSGQDTVFLAAGSSDTIQLSSSASDLVRGPTSGGGASLTFMGGSTQASTVLGGEGSYTIFGGAGGGYFHGGSSGSNLLEAGNGGPTKLIAGGASDTLQGGNSIDSLIAAAGNETLISGSGTQILNLRIHLTSGTSGVGTTDTVQNFGSQDYFDYGGTHAINVALQSYQVSGGSGSFSLADGSTVVLQGYTGSISSNDFIKH